MNYTQTYRFPQWELSDRILMDDFNQMCLTMENGLNRSDRTGWLATALGRDVYLQAVQQKILNRPGGKSDAMWVNALASRQDAGDGHGWNGRYGVSSHPNPPTRDGIKSTVVQISKITTAYAVKSRKAAVSFTADGYGTLETAAVYTWCHPSGTAVDFPYTVTLTRTDTGEIVGTAGPFTSIDSKDAVLPLGFPLEAATPYRLEYALPDDSKFYGTSEFLLGSVYDEDDELDLYPGSDGNYTVTFTGRTVASTLTHTVARPGDAVGASGLIHWLGGGAVSLLINGVPMQAVRTREDVNVEGVNCKETEYSLDALPAGNLTVTMEMDSSGGAVTVFDYGLIWK